MDNISMLTIDQDTTIGEILRTIPGADSVIKKYFGNGCHHCASQQTEPIWIAAKLYGHSVEVILHDLHALTEYPQLIVVASAKSARERRLERESQNQSD